MSRTNVTIQSGNAPIAIPGVESAVDVLRGSFRNSLSPVDHADPATQNVYGFYGVSQASGATVSIGAAGHLGSIRWGITTGQVLTLLKIRVGYTVTGAITTSTPMDLQAVIARGFTVDFTTASTAANLAAVSNTNKFRSSNMGSSLMGTSGPRIATTTVMSGQTLTADANPFAMCSFPGITAVNATGTAVAMPVGAGAPMQDLYRWDPTMHPIVLQANEGVLIQPVTAGPATGSVKYYFEWSWAELPGF